MKMGEDVDICTAEVAKIKASVAKMSRDTLNNVQSIKKETREELVTISRRVSQSNSKTEDINARLKIVEEEFKQLQTKVQEKSEILHGLKYQIDDMSLQKMSVATAEHSFA